MNKNIIKSALLLIAISSISNAEVIDKNIKLEKEFEFLPYISKPVVEHINVPQQELVPDVKDDPIKGTIRFLDLFECKDLIFKRGIWVWLPEGYTDGNGPYAVIYFHDAQNLFLPSKSFSGKDWKVDETIMDLMNKQEIKPTIVVGIPNSPARDIELNTATKEGKSYSNFIINEVMPFIKEKFPVSKRKENHIIAGSSMGGLISFQMAFDHPDKFGGAICMSPAFLRQISGVLNQVKNCQKPPLNTKFYIDSGDQETQPEEGFSENILQVFQEMKDTLQEIGFHEDKNMKSVLQKDAHHNEAFWAERLPEAVKFMLKR